MQLPKQLQNKSFRFIKVVSKTKRASEKNWQDSNNYKYTETEFQKYLKNGAAAYGVLCGSGKLAVIDCDKDELAQRLLMQLPSTFTVKTGSGGFHLYYVINDLDKKIVIENDEDIHYGEVQFNGSYVVGPNSKHPNGNNYAIHSNLPISQITKNELLISLKGFLKTEKEFTPINSGLNLDINNVLATLKGLKQKNNGEWQGPHPVHGSTTKQNFTLYPDKNVWYCHRCHNGGDAVTLIAVLNKKIKCSEAKPGLFVGKNKLFLECLRLAKDKYHYDTPELSRRLANTSKSVTAETGLQLFKAKGQKKGPLDIVKIVEYINSRCYFITVRDATGRQPHVYIYEDGYYKLNGEDYLVKMIKEMFRDKDADFTSHYKNEIIEYLKTENIVDRDDIETPKHLINLNNGVYNIETNMLLAHDPKYYFLYKIPWNYNPKVKIKKIMQYFKDTLKSDYIKFSQELFGYCLQFDYRIAGIFYLYGTGGNGKSVWINMLEKLLGSKNVSNKSIDSLTRYRFTSSLLYGKLVNVCGELSSTTLKDTDMLKRLSAGDQVEAEFKGKDGFDFKNKAKIITACNYIPYCNDLSDGWYQRQYIIPFLKKFRDSKKEDIDLIKKLTTKEEMEGLLMWSLEGLKRILKNKRLSYPVDRKKRYLMSQENTIYFINHCYRRTDNFNDYIEITEMRNDYHKWCQENDIPQESENAFARTLTNIGIKSSELPTTGRTHTYVRRYLKKVK